LARPLRKLSKTSMGSPSGLVADFNMIGGTAATRTAFATRFVPYRPM
jgi:hypothetical protein